MTWPFALPAWVPWWVPILVLIPVLLYALVLFVMPFSVIGVKGRLETLDARLDEIQGEIRNLVLRLPESMSGRAYEDSGYTPPPVFSEPPAAERVSKVTPRPPIPPAPLVSEREDGEAGGRRREGDRASGRPTRSEPRLDWPR